MWTYAPTYAASILSKELMSIFSPITPVCSVNFSATVIPPKSAAKNSSFVLKLIATKSVSHPKTIATPAVLSAFTFEAATPSEDSRSALFAATFWPFLRRMSIALSKSPSASTNAFLQSSSFS